MTLTPLPSAEAIVQLYRDGELAVELARYHETPADSEEPFIQRCIDLHNCGDIDLIAVTSQPAFAKVTGMEFFAAQHLYCEAIPKLRTDIEPLMQCCRILVDRGGSDGAATFPYEAFRSWCRNNPDGAAAVIRDARADNSLAKQFVAFALQACEDANSAIDFIQSYKDERRLAGMAALSAMSFSDDIEAGHAIAAVEPFVDSSSDDHLRFSALVAAFDLLKGRNDTEAQTRLIEAASVRPGPETLCGIARVLLLYGPTLNSEALKVALSALESLDTAHGGTVRIVDLALQRLLESSGGSLAVDLLTAILRDDKLTIENFPSTAHGLRSKDSKRLYEIIVRWFLSGSLALCNNAGELIGLRQAPFDTDATALRLTSSQLVFLCRKAIGWLFLKPVVCCSIIVSVLRIRDKEVHDQVVELLFDPILLSYGGDARSYLRGISPADPAFNAVQEALNRDEAHYSALMAIGIIKELHPGDYQRTVVQRRTRDQMRKAVKSAQDQSVLLSLVHRSTILYGKRALTYVQDPDGGVRAVAIDPKPISTKFELPRREIVDPVGLDYQLRMFRAERLK